MTALVVILIVLIIFVLSKLPVSATKKPRRKDNSIQYHKPGDPTQTRLPWLGGVKTKKKGLFDD